MGVWDLPGTAAAPVPAAAPILAVGSVSVPLIPEDAESNREDVVCHLAQNLRTESEWDAKKI